MKITFADKVDKKTVALPAKNKVVAADMNEIKASVNYIYDEDFILALDKRIIAGANRAGLGKGTTDMGGDGGVSNFCAVGFEENFQAGVKYFRNDAQEILALREYRGGTPDNTFDVNAGFIVDSVIEFFDGTTYKCTDNTVNSAIWELIQSGTNNGDETTSSIKYKLGVSTLSGTNTGDETSSTIINKIGNGSTINQSYLPSYVDDVIEGYKSGSNFYSDIALTILITGEAGKIYVDLSAGQSSKQYRWSGSAYIQITNGLIASTNDVSEGANLYFTTARVLSTLLTGLSLITGGAIVSTDSILVAFGKVQKQITDLTSSKWGKSGDSVSAGDFIGTTNNIPFLIKVFNKLWLKIEDSTNSILFGYNAGVGASSLSDTIAIGMGAGNNSSNVLYSILIGRYAGANATGSNSTSIFLGAGAGTGGVACYQCVFVGSNAGGGASASTSVFIGDNSGYNSSGTYLCNYIGLQSGYTSVGGYDSNFIGAEAGKSSTNAHNCNFIGFHAGKSSTGNNVNAFGSNAGEGNALSGQSIFSNASLPSFANRAAATTAITVALGAVANNTYLYYNQATFTIEAVRL